MTTEESLTRENGLVLSLLQAAMGNLSDGILALALEVTGEEIVLHWAVSEPTDDTREDIEVTVAELGGLLGPETPQISALVHHGPPDASWAGRRHRLGYLSSEVGSRMKRTEVLLSFQRALLGVVTPELRGVRVDWDEAQVRGIFLYAGSTIGLEQQKDVNEVETEVFADFDPLDVVCRAEPVPADEPLRHEAGDVSVYRRKERSE